MRRVMLFMILMIAVSCNYDEMVEVVAFGVRNKDITVPAAASQGKIEIISNVNYNVEMIDEADWCTLSASGYISSACEELSYSCQADMGYSRMARVKLWHESRVDTVYIRQQGALKDRVSLYSKSFEVPSSGGEYDTEVECFRCPDRLMVEVSDPEMVQATYAEGRLYVTVAPAVSRYAKTYSVVVYYIDGWGKRASDTAIFIQEPIKIK